MRSTRTYVINIRNIIKIFAGLAVLICILYASMAGDLLSIIQKAARDYTQKKQNIIAVIPALCVTEEESPPSATMEFILEVLFNEKLDNPSKILAGRLAYVSGVKEHIAAMYHFVTESNFLYVPKLLPEKKPDPLPEAPTELNPALEITSASIKSNGNELEKKGITIKNHTSYSPDISALYESGLNLKRTGDAPQILIIHTHGSESYNPTDRNQDIEKNIVKVGAEMEKVFTQQGINVIHSTVMHDIPKFSNSYGKSLETINAILAQYPSINIVLDIHRDAMQNEKGENYKVVAEIDGQKCAQVMFVVGTNQGGLSHDGWQENLKLAIKLQEQINSKYPNLARAIDLRKERFNQHATPGSLIIEVGTNANTLNEAILSGRYTAMSISELLNRLN